MTRKNPKRIHINEDVEEMSSPGGRDFDSDDEEIDEDEAFNTEDEEAYGHFFNKDQNRDDDDSDDDDDEEEVPQETILDKIKDDSDSDENASESSDSNPDSDEELDDENSDDEEVESESSDDDDDENDNHSAAKRLLQVVDDLVDMDHEDSDLIALAKDIQKNGTGNLSGKAGKNASKLSMERLMGSLKGSAKYGQLRERLEKVAEAQSIKEPTAEAIAKRGERRAGYDVAKSEASEWVPIIQDHRKADFVTFPLKQPDREISSTDKIAESFETQNLLEKEIENALKSSGLQDDTAIIANEEKYMLEYNKLDPEQVQARQAELSKLRALMFYSEQKAKRTKKIKSKLFRRLRKRRLAREDEKELAKLRELDPEAAREIEEKAAVDRAKERMSLKHKNASKFMKSLARNRGAHIEASREAILEQNAEHQRLMQRMKTRNDDSDDSDDDYVDGATAEQIAKAKLERMLNGIQQDASGEGPAKGIYALKFMQKALQRQQEDARKDTAKLLESMDNMDEAYDSEDNDKGQNNDAPAASQASTIMGRMKLGPKGQKTKSQELAQVKTVEKDMPQIVSRRPEASSHGTEEPRPKRKMFDVPEYQVEKAPKKKPVKPVEETSSNNPWIQPTSQNKRHATKSNDTSVQVKISKSLETEVLDDAEKAKRQEQAKLIKRAFAGSSTFEEDFAAEKRDEEMLEEEKLRLKEQKVQELPGWGSWAGSGVLPKPKPAAPKPEASKTAQKKRKATETSGLKHVVVSQKRNKNITKYMADDVPYPFTSREQYEMSLRNPLGNDWNTVSTFKTLNRPSIAVRSGTIIDPIEKPTKK